MATYSCPKHGKLLMSKTCPQCLDEMIELAYKALAELKRMTSLCPFCGPDDEYCHKHALLIGGLEDALLPVR